MTLKYTTVGEKQDGSNDRWQYVWENIASIVPQSRAQEIVGIAAEEVKKTVAGRKVGYGWSGGKDSQALRVVMNELGIERCVLGMTNELEYPAFLRWVTDNMPFMLDVVASNHTLSWLQKNQGMLFPQDSNIAAKWFKQVQHKAQEVFCKRYGLDLIILGRRHADRNYTGRDGNGVYTNAQGITRYSPIRHWTHEETLAVCHYYNMPMPPFYEWVNGWVVGTGNWAQRQWTKTTANGWNELYQIDPSIVRLASTKIPSAAKYRAAIGG